MELYILVAKLVANTKNKYEDYRILKVDNQIPIAQQVPAGYEKKGGPASLDDCVKYLRSCLNIRQFLFLSSKMTNIIA